MAKRRELNAMSAEELYALARQRAKEEKELEKESVREEIAELETQKKDLIAEYKAAVGELDKEIRKLRKKVGGRRNDAEQVGRLAPAHVSDLLGVGINCALGPEQRRCGGCRKVSCHRRNASLASLCR